MATAAETSEELVSVLENWQKIENATIAHTTEVIGKTKNPLIQILPDNLHQDLDERVLGLADYFGSVRDGGVLNLLPILED